jgi:cation transport regulator ChaB
MSKNLSGSDRLWLWFSLSYANFLTLPRALMHQMPEEWQDKMAELLEEFDDTYKNTPTRRS